MTKELINYDNKIMLNCDYCEGAHQNIINALVDTNLQQTLGYGDDYICDLAKKCIKKHLKNDNVDIHFLIVGTSTNQIVISSCLKSYEGVLTVDSGHINIHETGAIEVTGHKVISITNNYKLTADDVEKFCINQQNQDGNEHYVQGKMVFIAFPTEYGLLYSKKELEDIYNICKKYDFYLYLDGARLAFAFNNNDIKFEDLPNLCDIFYIGGTKCGALFGEAVVIVNDKLKEGFRFNIKQRGALLAKGRLLGIQFFELFKDNLYFEIGKNTVFLAMYLKEKLLEKNVKFLTNSFTNQQFIIITNEQYNKINEHFIVNYCGNYNNDIIVRVCTSWATKKKDIDKFIKLF